MRRHVLLTQLGHTRYWRIVQDEIQQSYVELSARYCFNIAIASSNPTGEIPTVTGAGITVSKGGVRCVYMDSRTVIETAETFQFCISAVLSSVLFYIDTAAV